MNFRQAIPSVMDTHWVLHFLRHEAQTRYTVTLSHCAGCRSTSHIAWDQPSRISWPVLLTITRTCEVLVCITVSCESGRFLTRASRSNIGLDYAAKSNKQRAPCGMSARFYSIDRKFWESCGFSRNKLRLEAKGSLCDPGRAMFASILYSSFFIPSVLHSDSDCTCLGTSPV